MEQQREEIRVGDRVHVHGTGVVEKVRGGEILVLIHGQMVPFRVGQVDLVKKREERERDDAIS